MHNDTSKNINMQVDDNLLTINEVKDRLRISRRMVYKLIDSKKLKVKKVGRATRFRASEIEKFIKAN